MAQNNLVLQKMLRVTPETHARVMVLVGELQARGIKGSQDAALRALLDGWKELGLLSEREGLRFGHTELLYVESDFLDKHFR